MLEVESLKKELEERATQVDPIAELEQLKKELEEKTTQVDAVEAPVA